MSIQALRERKNHLVTQCKAQLAEKGAQTWTKDDQATYDLAQDEIERLDRQISAHQKDLDDEAGKIVKAQKSDDPKDQIRKIHDKWCRHGEKAVTAEEWAIIQNTMSTGTPSEGGYTTQTEVSKTVVEAVKSYGGMRDLAETFATSKGNPLQYPTSDGTSEEGEIVGENAAASDQDVVFGTVGLGVYRFSSKVITVPIELLQDSEVDVEAFINSRLRTRLGRIQNKKFTIGTGINEPRGLIPGIGIGKIGSAGQVATVTYDDLVDLQESIDEGYGTGNLQWMLHQQSRRVIRKIKDTTGRPIWTPGYEYGVTKGSPDELLGRAVKINNDMPTMAASAKSITFGDHSFYKIRDALDVTLFRFTDSAYAKKGQVGFLAFMRSGGNWVDVGGAVKSYQNPAA